MSRGAHDFPPPPFCKCNKFVNIGDASCVGFHAHLFRDELLVELGFVNIGDASCVGFHTHLFRDGLLVELG
jgi:hypothetical protein